MRQQWTSQAWHGVLGAVLAWLGMSGPAGAANPDGDLRVEIVTAYNLIVDSNAESPSTYAPKSAYIGAKFCNDGDNALTNVWAYIGDLAAGTPGTYPSRTHAPLVGPLPGGAFALEHEGGTLGAADATRYIGTIQPGECVTVYWLASYPQLDENGDAVWGDSVKPDDDLWLEYDVWASAQDGAAHLQADDTRTLTCRNEISAMANKIWPNSANKVPQEYQDLLQQYAPLWTNTSAVAEPGAILRTEGIWYDLGNIGDGFDNDGDLVPDRNAWLQPVGDPDLFDPSCFRLIRTYVMVIVKLNDGTEQVIVAEDQLYFTQIPENNRGAVGYVMYEFMAIGSGCVSTLTPYQEVASGFDNEKFNGDYGAPGQTLTGGTSLLAIAKSADPVVTRPGSNIAYTVTYTNSGPDASGRPDIGLPLVVQDSIPSGTVYVAGSAAPSNVLPAGVSGYTIYYSTNHGLTWSLAEPAVATNVTDVQWWLSDPLPSGGAGTVRFSVVVQTPWPFPSPIVPNTAGLSFGNTTPFLTADAQTLLLGNNALGDLVWRDDGTGGGLLGNQRQDGGETGITGVTVRLYYDLGGDGTADYLFATTSTVANGYYSFTNLPDGNFVVAVDAADPDLPYGYTPTTPATWPIALDPARTNVNPVVDWTADFGFAPALTLVKTRSSTNAVREGQLIRYNLAVSNSLPGNGTGAAMPATYLAWATSGTGNATEWHSYTNIFVPPWPDGNYATNHFENTTKFVYLSNFTFGVQNGNITNVALVVPMVMVQPTGPDDTFTIQVSTISPAAVRFESAYMATGLVSGTWTIPMTGTYAWTWADFSSNVSVRLSAEKNAGGAGAGYIMIDAIGFQLQSDRTTGVAGATTTLDPVPLTDVFDPAKLRYVGAEPPATSVSTNGIGTLYWDNVGPIHPGGTSTVAVTFKLLEPPNNTNTVVTNTTWVTNAYFQGGAHANSATSSVVVTQFPAATVGDYVWRDMDGDGVQDTNETGIASVAVSLTPPAGIDLGAGAGVPITNWTDANGYYLFESIPSTGVYTVRVVTATLPGGTGTNTFDEDGVKDHTHAVYLDIYSAPSSTNNIHLTTDFGYRLGSTIEGSIWHDYDRGGESFREPGEDWLTNVTVYLCASPSPCGAGASLATNYADTNGYFRFVGNYTGTYTVAVATNTGMMSNGTWRLSFDTDGTNTANYSAVTVPSGGVGRVDFSYYRSGAYRIGDTLFYDWNSNGVQDVASEEGISGVTVRLYEDANGNGVVDTNVDAYLATTFTGTNGYYVFTNLFATNTYLVIVDREDPDLPANYLVTADPYGAKDGRSVVTLVNADNLDQDFGFWPYGNGAIGDTVWLDRNADGVQFGTQEPGISNILVTLYADFNGDGTYLPLRTTNTGASGLYLFEDLPDGDYRVVVDDADTDLPADAFGNVYYPTTATACDVTISGGNTYLDADFGFAPYGAIGDTVFWDANRDGEQDYTEDGVPGAVVQLYDDANANGVYDAGETLLASETTDVNGLYLFDGLLPDRYAVRVVTDSGPLAGADQTADPNSDGLTCSDTNLVVPCDSQYGLPLASGQIFMGADFGYAPSGVIGDTLWIDANDNGARDANELGIPYVSVILYSNGVAIATNVTDADGYYGFSGLLDATYGVGVATNDADFPAGLSNTWTADGTLDNHATNIVISGGQVVSIGGLPCTDCDLSVDFGYRYAGNNSLSGTIGLDATPYDGLMNGLGPSGAGAGESPYAGVAVTLYLWNDDGDGVLEAGEYVQIGTETTGANGDYAFTDLPSGDGNDQYVVASAAPEDSLKLTTTNGSIAGVTVVATSDAQGDTVSAYLAIAVAADITNMDFAYQSLTQYDYGDLPDSYATTLPDGARHVIGPTTNLYLGAGVDVESDGVPSSGADGDDLAGTDDEDGVIQITNSVWRIGTSGGSVEVTVGAGSGWLLGYVDFNGDGDFTDMDEMVCSMAVSNSGGNGAGVYTNEFTVPSGTFSTTSSTPLYARFRLFPEEPMFPELSFAGTADNGEVEDYLWHLAGIGDMVWYDSDGDGVQDAGESPISGVRVFADLNDDGVYQTNEPSSTTGADGLYGIGGLVPGTYSVVVDTNTLVAGVTPTYDLDGIATAHKTAVAITNLDQFVDAADFGYAPPVAIGDRIWFDANRDGIQDAGETNGIPSIPVDLLDTNGNIQASTVSGASGNYLFSNMPTGTYLVRFDLTSLTTNEMLSPSNAGNDDAVDSDAIAGNTTDYAWTAPFSVAGGETLLTVDLGICTRTPTRIEMAAMWGEWVDGQGQVAWRTRSEFSAAGFFLYRIDPETGVETRLNERLLPSTFQEDGATYRLADPEARQDEPATYRLEEVELSGAVAALGAHEVRFDAPPPPLPVPESPTKLRTAKASVAPRAVAGGATSSVLKVRVREEGLCGIGLAAIANGMGLAAGEVEALAAANSLRITEGGSPVPAIYDAVRGRLVFHAGSPARTWYTHEAAYLVSVGDGRAMPRREPAATAGVSVLPVQMHFEKDRFLFSMTQMPEDFYFWEGVVSETNDLLAPRFPLDLTGHAGGDVALKVRLMGWSNTTNDPDHLAEIRFNGASVASIAFDGQDTAEAVVTVPGASVSNGMNTLVVNGVRQPGLSHDFFVVDWIEASFDRALAPLPAPAQIRAGGAAAVSAQAFGEPLALALDDAGNPTWIADEDGRLPAKAWAVAVSNERFAVVEADAVPMLDPQPAAADAWFLSAANQIDYLVIVPRALASAAQELADYRSGQGLRTGVAVFEDICDLMAGGVPTPEAIPEFLGFAAATWEKSPRMVVLAGNGNYDYLGVMSNEVNHLPPMLVQTPAGICASDALLADAGGDERPDVAIGRLPALTVEDLSAMIAKIKAYEAGFGSAWQNQLVLVADAANSAGDFSAANTRLAEIVQAPYSVAERIDLGTMEIGLARTNLLGWFHAGAGFIHYTGHGGLHNFSAQNLLTEEDVAAMSNAVHPSIAVALSCLVGRYEVPAVSSLGESLLRRPGGAVAVLGPSGLSLNAPATELGEAFYRAILQEGEGRLGLAFLKARRSLPDTLFTKDSFAVYNLLGDPALRIAGNPASEEGGIAAQVFLQGMAQTYDGTERAVTAATGPAGLVVRITYDGSATPPLAAGRYAVTGIVTTAGYEGLSTGTLVVAKASAAVSLNSLAQTYDGSPRHVAATTLPDGLAVDFTYDGSPAAPTEAGSYEMVATVNDANYEGAATGTLVVAKAPAAVSLGGLAQTYDWTPKNVAATTLPAGLALHVTYNGWPDAPTEAGSYAVAATVDDANYEGSATGTLVVAKAPATVTLGDLVEVYDGTPKVATATTTPEELAIDFSYGGSPKAPVAAGQYPVTGTVSEPNWRGSASGVLTIRKAGQTIQFPPVGDQVLSNVVDLAATASSRLPVSFSVVSGPAVVVDGAKLTFTGLGSVSVMASQAGDANWNAAPPVVNTFHVSPLELSVRRVRVREGGEGRFFVRLSREPASLTTVTVTRVEGDVSLVVQGGAVRLFKASNWSTWQSVTLSAGPDGNGDNETATFRVSVPGQGDQLVLAEALDNDIGENLALASGGATIAGRGSYQSLQLIDGVYNSSTNYGYTTWKLQPPGAVTLDLREAVPVSRVRLLNWDWVYRTHRYTIETSVDGTNWLLLADASGEDHQGWDDWPVADRMTRYLRFTGLSNSANDYVVISELEVYGSYAPPSWLEISKTKVNVREGGEGRFFVRMASAPESNVTVGVSVVAGDGSIAVQNGAARTFRASNWDVWQAVTLSAAPDDNGASEAATIRISAPGREDLYVEAGALDDDIGDNLALASGGSAIAGQGAGQAAQLIDGVHAASTNYGYTLWTNNPPGTMTLDLQSAAVVSRVRLLNWDWVYRVHRYKIESSLDGTTWSILADAGWKGHHGWDDWPVDGRTIRYLRFTGLSNSANDYVCLSEWEVYGVRAPLPQIEVSKEIVPVREGGEGRFFLRLPRAPDGTVLASVVRVGGEGAIAVQSGASRSFKASNWNIWQAVTLAAGEDENGGNETAVFRISAPGMEDRLVEAVVLDDDIGENLALAAGGATIAGTKAALLPAVIDGIHNAGANYGYTVWSNQPPGTMTLDLHAVATVSRVRLLNWDWVYRVHRYQIESSPDGTNWSLLADASAEDHHGWDDWPVADLPIRYLRFTGLSNSVNSTVCLSELEIYGHRPVARRAPASAKGASPDSFPLTVVTSDDGPEHTNGWAAVDGDTNTWWTGRAGAGGWYIAIGYDSPLTMTNLLVDLAEGSATRMECLYSLDGEEWTELPPDAPGGPVELNYLWLLFPGEDSTSPEPRVIEIRPLP